MHHPRPEGTMIGEPPKCPDTHGFSLLELLVVVGVITILLGIGVPAFNSFSRSLALERATQQVADGLTLARDQAIARNRTAELRFISVPSSDGTEFVGAIQAWINEDDAGNMAPITRPIWLPETCVVSDESTLSPLLASTSLSSGTMQLLGENRSYRAVAYRNDSSIDLGSSGVDTFLTLVSREEATATAAPDNFRSIYINPVTGEIRIFRP